MILTQEQIDFVSAGLAAKSAIEAVSIAIQIYEGSSLIVDASQSTLVQSTQIYTKLGAKLGEQIFNITHPNPLGKMSYSASDF